MIGDISIAFQKLAISLTWMKKNIRNTYFLLKKVFKKIIKKYFEHSV
jgi:hypothetical protein